MELQRSKKKALSPFSYRPSKGVTIRDKKVTVPSQSMSLKEILERFVRGEKVPVQKQTSYIDSPVDLEKIRYGDLVERAEYSNYLSEIQKKYQRQERARQAKTVPKTETGQPPAGSEAPPATPPAT